MPSSHSTLIHIPIQPGHESVPKQKLLGGHFKANCNLDAGVKIFIEGYGVMDLLRMRKEERGYIIFQCIDEDGVFEVKLAVRSEWCVSRRKEAGWYDKAKKFITTLLPLGHDGAITKPSKEVIQLLTCQ
jgi:hypothetical protein